ncbi:MAG: hypothetical protein WCK67_07795 [bacterium]
MVKRDFIKRNPTPFHNKFTFIGISLSPLATADSGIAVMDKDLNILRIDKFYNIEDFTQYLSCFGPCDSSVFCIDLPKNIAIVNGKWRYESRYTKMFKLRDHGENKFVWAERFSDRGADFCDMLKGEGLDVYRHYSYFTKNSLDLLPPFKARTPSAGRYLQMTIEDKLNIKGIPPSFLALSGLDAVIAAYAAWKSVNTEENKGFKILGDYKEIPIISAL